MLVLKDIVFDYKGRGRSFTIEIPELTVSASGVTCLLGKNGSGKTTLLGIIGGHLQPSRGIVLLNSEDISKTRAQQRPISTVFQDLGLFPHLTVRQNIELAIDPNRLFATSAVAKDQAGRILTEFDLASLGEKKPSQLSIGQQQKVALARAISRNPVVLLLDEPTSALDFENIRNLKQLLHRVKSAGLVPVILIVSHDLHFVMSVSDEIKYIENGRIVFEGTTEAFAKSQYYVN